MIEENFWNSTSFLSVVFAGKKQPMQVEAITEIRKKINLEVVMTFFQKFPQNTQILKCWVSVSVSNFKPRVSVSEFLMKSQSQSFNEVSVSKY